ncbi:MAG: lipopolysaccharide transport periplasmic protein LptA [Burkholderiales bacterium]
MNRISPFVLALALAAGPAHAEKTDREKPVSFSSDGGEVNYETRSGVLTGNVVITQGTLTIRADRINFKQNPDNSISATAFGNPIAFRQKRDDADGWYEGWAQRAEYDGSKDQLELFENAILKRGADEIRSNFISYNAKTELFRAEGRPSATPIPGETGRTDRVRGTFQPKDNQVPGKGPAAKPSAPLTLTPSGELAPAK